MNPKLWNDNSKNINLEVRDRWNKCREHQSSSHVVCGVCVNVCACACMFVFTSRAECEESTHAVLGKCPPTVFLMVNQAQVCLLFNRWSWRWCPPGSLSPPVLLESSIPGPGSPSFSPSSLVMMVYRPGHFQKISLCCRMLLWWNNF